MGHILNDLTVLITAAGSPGVPGLIKSLRNNGERRIKIIASDLCPEAAGLYLADKKYIEPSAGDPDYTDKILEICVKEKVNVVIPNIGLMPLAENLPKFEKVGIKILVSRNPASLKRATDKGALYKFLNANAIPIPQYRVVRSFKEFMDAVNFLGYPDKKVCFKPVISEGARGFHILDKRIDKARVLLYEKPDNIVTTAEDVAETLKSITGFPELIVMEYLTGKEYSADALIFSGKMVAVVPRYRQEIRGGISVVGIVEDNKEVISLCQKISRCIDLEFNINIQLKYSESAGLKVVEVNPRVSGTLVLCTGAKINLAYLGLKALLGEPFSSPRPIYGTKMVRFWSEVFIDENGLSYTL